MMSSNFRNNNEKNLNCAQKELFGRWLFKAIYASLVLADCLPACLILKICVLCKKTCFEINTNAGRIIGCGLLFFH